MSTRSGSTRRKMLRNLGALAAAGVAADAARPAESRAATQGAIVGPNPPRVLALIGDRYHNADYIRVALGRTFRELNIPIEFTIKHDAINEHG